MIIRKAASELKRMRQASLIVAETIDIIAEVIKPGITTLKLNQLAEEYILSRGGKPAFKGYQGFPSSICTSVNEGVVHGIPGAKKLESGDIIGIDIGVLFKGYYGDAAVTFPVGIISKEAERLISAARQALMAGIKKCYLGNRLSDISSAIQTTAESAGFSVVKNFVGHGIGRSMHEDPQIPNFGSPGKGPKLEVGITFAIEPMLNMGGSEVEVLEDGWTVVTKDRSLSAHFEHTVAVNRDGPEILTKL